MSLLTQAAPESPFGSGVRARRLSIASRAVALVLAVLAPLCATRAFADEDAEREHLARLSYELQRLQQEVSDAQRNAEEGGRVRFRYDWLARDLQLVQRGVDEHLDAPRQPRPAPPLRGDYRQ